MARYRLTGVSAGPFGVQWRTTPSDRDVAKQLIYELGDRRVLWEPAHLERPDWCAASASYMRTFIGTLLKTPGLSGNLKTTLTSMQRHFRQFMTDLTAYGLDRPDADFHEVETVLSWLRGPIGVQIGLLAAQYDLEVPQELSAIVPSQGDWFFEPFRG